jgi:hypothetical protein
MSDTFRKRAFKIGFLRGLADVGVTPNEFFGLVKRAFTPVDLITGPLAGISEVGKSALTTGGEMLGGTAKAVGAAALLAPLAAGGITGATSAALDAPTTGDIEVMRKAELIGLYKRLTEEIQARRKQKQRVA